MTIGLLSSKEKLFVSLYAYAAYYPTQFDLGHQNLPIPCWPSPIAHRLKTPNHSAISTQHHCHDCIIIDLNLVNPPNFPGIYGHHSCVRGYYLISKNISPTNRDVERPFWKLIFRRRWKGKMSFRLILHVGELHIILSPRLLTLKFWLFPDEIVCPFLVHFWTPSNVSVWPTITDL